MRTFCLNNKATTFRDHGELFDGLPQHLATEILDLRGDGGLEIRNKQ